MEKKNKKSAPYPSSHSTEVHTLQEPFASFAREAGVAAGFPDLFGQIAAARRGIPKSNLFSIADMYGVTLEQLSSWLHSSYRNLQRKQSSALLDAQKSEKLLELAALAHRGTEVLGSLALFRQWVQSPLLALSHKTPADFLDTSFGIQYITGLLGRLEQGVYS